MASDKLELQEGAIALGQSIYALLKVRALFVEGLSTYQAGWLTAVVRSLECLSGVLADLGAHYPDSEPKFYGSEPHCSDPVGSILTSLQTFLAEMLSDLERPNLVSATSIEVRVETYFSILLSVLEVETS